MEVLAPAPLPPLDRGVGVKQARQLQLRSRSRSSAVTHGGEGLVYIAVGRSMEKTVALLQGTFRRYGCNEVVLIHVHQPSPTIPTLLGKLPASQASENLVSAYRRKERGYIKKILLSYMVVCYKSQVKANIIMTENDSIQKGILDLVSKHAIGKLVVGAAPLDSCFKVKGKPNPVTFLAKKAPGFCEVCFISKGRHVWTREASEDAYLLLPPPTSNGTCAIEMVISRSSSTNGEEFVLSSNPPHSVSSDLKGRNIGECNSTEVAYPSDDFGVLENLTYSASEMSGSLNEKLCSPSESATKTMASKGDLKRKSLCNRIDEVKMEAEKSKEKAFRELVKRKNSELEISEAIGRAKALQVGYVHEAKLKKKIEEQSGSVRQMLQGLTEQWNEAMRELEITMKSISCLENQAQELASHRDEVVRNLDVAQESFEALRLERHKISLQREEAAPPLERWKRRSHAFSPKSNRVAFGNASISFTEFSLSELQNATCEFSESFKLGEGAYGRVYKGEMMNRTVAIRKLHAHNLQGLSEFEQEVFVLGKLRHPHLVTLIGVCPQAMCLVYEYLPNGTLQDRLFCKTSSPLSWEVRTRIIAEISSALHFLHSSKPEMIIHGDLKPGNIFLDTNFNCKIGDFGICRLVPDDAEYSLYRRDSGPKGTFSYADPEYQRTGELTSKADVYSFGVIILQLLTGKPPVGLVSEVRRAMSAGTLSLIMDSSAGEWPLSVARKLAEFGLHCTQMGSRDRPELTPVIVRDLKELYVSEQRPVPQYFLCPILQEIMHDPQVAADGFTYEGSAIQEWLRNGRETSPMTNLKLDHSNLTPNHALRLFIQDWLCQT